jgi:hypothetical protein
MMSLFTPPTDNLYKFLAVSGIVFFIAGVYFPPVFFRQTGMEYLAQLRSSDELKAHEKFVDQRLKILDARKQQALEDKDKLQQRLDKLKSASNSIEADKLEARIKEANHEIESIADSADELSLNLELKRAQINYEETVSLNSRRDSRRVLLIGWVLGLVGVSFIIIGFQRWYRRLQKFQDRLVLQEAESKLTANATNEQNKSPQPSQPTQDNVAESPK